MITVQDLKNIVQGDSPDDSRAREIVAGISVDSRTVKEGEAFFAIPGTKYEGIDFIHHALTRGAVCGISKRVPDGVDPSRVIIVKDPIDALTKFSAEFYGDPSSHMKVVGITGTNGKTTITYLLESIARQSGNRGGVIGTINYRVGDVVLREGLTTPFPQDLQEAMARMRSMGGTYVFMEVSSHGISQRRVANIHFDAGIFSNLSRDHLDYHGNMENYFEVKKRFFTGILPSEIKNGVSIINIDSSYGRRLAGEIGTNIITYGNSNGAQISISNARFSIDGITGDVSTPDGNIEIRSGLIGHHNLENILASVSYSYHCGIGHDQIAEGVFALKAVPGRLERVQLEKPVHVFVDYAHTPDGLKNVLHALTAVKRRRLIVVFGCGGDRDRGKRPLMGSVAGELADLSVITSDNPRREDPLSIIEEIVPGCEMGGAKRWVKGGKDSHGKRVFLLEPDRRNAIHMSIEMAREGDIVVIAGKGHEPYQIIGEKKIDFDDREVVRSMSG